MSKLKPLEQRNANQNAGSSIVDKIFEKSQIQQLEEELKTERKKKEEAQETVRELVEQLEDLELDKEEHEVTIQELESELTLTKNEKSAIQNKLTQEVLYANSKVNYADYKFEVFGKLLKSGLYKQDILEIMYEHLEDSNKLELLFNGNESFSLELFARKCIEKKGFNLKNITQQEDDMSKKVEDNSLNFAELQPEELSGDPDDSQIAGEGSEFNNIYGE